jgi:RNA polymerase sigma-70 factor (ECF subfamily)
VVRSDGELLEAWQAGDRAAGEALFERYYGVLVRFFANKIGGDPMDLIQETFVGCVSGQARLRDRQGFRSFLFGIACNRLKKHYERLRLDGERFDPATQTAADLSPGPGTMLTKSREQRILLEALRGLPVRYQVVLELYYWEELTAVEIGEALELPEGTVRTRLRRARALLERGIGVAEDPRVGEATREDLDGWVASVRAAQRG